MEPITHLKASSAVEQQKWAASGTAPKPAVSTTDYRGMGTAAPQIGKTAAQPSK